MSELRMFKVRVSAKDLEMLSQLISAAANGRAIDFSGKDISVSSELFEESQRWSDMAAGVCHSCLHHGTGLNHADHIHAIDDEGGCALTET